MMFIELGNLLSREEALIVLVKQRENEKFENSVESLCLLFSFCTSFFRLNSKKNRHKSNKKHKFIGIFLTTSEQNDDTNWSQMNEKIHFYVDAIRKTRSNKLFLF
jgi:hypothetical protein